MRDADRFKLLGAYRTPRVRVGAVLSCEARDCDLTVVRYSAGPIPWPVGHAAEVGGRASLVVYGGLARAVRRESYQAVAHWFGVSQSVVTKWRAALGVTRTNPGSTRLREAVASDPDRRRQIAAAKRGKPRPAHVVEAVRKANKGRQASPKTRATLAAAMRERAKAFVPNGRGWTAAEDELVRTRPAAEVAEWTGRTLTGVYSRRVVLGVPDGRRRVGSRPGGG